MKNLETILNTVIIFSFILLVIATFIVMVDEDVSVYKEMQLETFGKCCNNTPCSDTYYDREKNVCVLSLCENSQLGFWGNRTKCEYQPNEWGLD